VFIIVKLKTKEDIEKFKGMVNAGEKFIKIAKEFGFSRQETVSRNVKKLGLKVVYKNVINSHGYVQIWNKEKQKYELEHRIVMEKMLGRKLKKGEIVHHKDLNKQNNKPSNLKLYQGHSAHQIGHIDELKRKVEMQL